MTREQIFATCRDIIREWGVQHLLMDELARRRGISKKTIYELFGSKEALMESLMADFLQQEEADFRQALQQQGPGLCDQLRFIIDYLIRLGELIPYGELEFLRKKHKPPFRMMMHYADSLLELIHARLQQARSEGQLPESHRPDMALQLLKAQLQHLHQHAGLLRQQYPLQHWSQYLAESFLNSLRQGV
ncbi:TetR/AcrR family transcriptional regulator [Cesiribacter andamanensis]|nr:TetR/AcrR family transcriptional regulator [Cesiribacter andamanensis]